MVLALGIASYVAAWRLGWVELAVVAAGCLMGMVLAAPFVAGKLKLDVVRTLEPERVMVGEPSMAIYEVTNPGGSAIRPRIIEDLVGTQPVVLEVPELASKATSSPIVYKLPTARRGAVQIGPAVIVKQDPLQLMRREVRQADAGTLWVHPRHEPVATLPVGYAKDLEGPTSENSPAGDVAFHALREYQVGDDYRHIHWMSTARTGTPMLRHYVDNRRPQLTVVVDDRETSMDADAFEVTVEIAASLAVTSMLARQPVAVWSTQGPLLGRTKPGSRDDALDRLSVVGQQATGDLDAASSVALQTETGASVLVVLTGGLDAQDLMLLVSQTRRKAKVVIVRVWPEGEATPAVVPGARVLDVESLAMFRRAWEQVAR